MCYYAFWCLLYWFGKDDAAMRVARSNSSSFSIRSDIWWYATPQVVFSSFNKFTIFFFASFQNQNWPKKKNFQTTSLLLSKLALLNYDIVWSFPQRIFKRSVSVSFQHIFQNVFYVLLQHSLILTIFAGLWISFILERYLVFRRRRRQNRTSVLRRLFGFLA